MYMSGRSLRLAALVVVILAGTLLSLRTTVRQSASYRVQTGYPSLVYVPGYEKGPWVTADSAVLIDQESGAILYAKAEHVRRAPASTTKILTALLAISYGKMEDVVVVSRRAASTPGSSVYLRAGDRLTLSELLKGVLMCSGNDGSVAIAEHLAGSEAEFARRMTIKARELGAMNSHFRNAHGLRAVGHYSTAYDLALLARRAVQERTFAALVSTRQSSMTWQDRQKIMQLNNTNRLLWSLEGADGVKTGTTSQAGKCLVASASRGGRRLIAAVLHCDDRWGDAARLLEYGFKNFTVLKGVQAGQVLATASIRGAKTRHLRLAARASVSITIPAGQEALVHRMIEVPREVKAPVKAGATIGRVGVFFGDQELASTDLLAVTGVKRSFLGFEW